MSNLAQPIERLAPPAGEADVKALARLLVDAVEPRTTRSSSTRN